MREFMGYVRENGKIGARNHLAVIPSVNCSNEVAKRISAQIPNSRSLNHHQGCCQLPPDLERATLSLTALGSSANVGAALIVSLGCEGTDVDYMAQEIAKTGKPVEVIRIQELGGTQKALEEGLRKGRLLADCIKDQKRQPVPMSECVMSIKCGASDATSGLASNCAIGYVADKIVDLGGTVIFGETTEFIGAEHILARRGRTPEVGKKIHEIVDRMETRAKSLGCDMRKGQPTPGNIAGGLSSIEEKSLGAIVKSGTKPIEGVLEYTDMVTDQKGLWIKDTPGREIEILTGMAITGAQAMCFSTGRGAPQGFPTMPVLKICGNPVTFAHLPDDMDINAGRIITGEKSIEEVGEEVFDRFVQVLSGQETKCEALQYFNSIDIYTMGPVI